MTNSKFLALACLLLATPIFIAGCSGPDIGQVSGSVTVNGKPLTTGSILFSNKEAGISINANLGDDGTFVIKTHKAEGLPPGEYQVAVKSVTFGGDETPLVGQRPTASAKPTVFIPPKYSNVNTSGLSATVKKGKNEPFVFDLK